MGTWAKLGCLEMSGQRLRCKGLGLNLGPVLKHVTLRCCTCCLITRPATETCRASLEVRFTLYISELSICFLAVTTAATRRERRHSGL